MKPGGFSALAFAGALCACAASPDVAVPVPARPVAIRNAGFEAAPLADRGCPSGWYCTMHADPHSFRYFHDESAPLHGRRSLCIEPVTREPWALLSQDVDITELRGATLRFSVAVRADSIDGDGAGPYALARSHAGAAIAQDKVLTKSSGGWRRMAVEITVPKESLGVEVGVALEGRGRVCADDSVLEIVRSGETPYNQAPVTPKQPSPKGEVK
ncbi:MAG: hypothetical protein ACXWG6_08865 [Usitatibacter sp.]